MPLETRHRFSRICHWKRLPLAFTAASYQNWTANAYELIGSSNSLSGGNSGTFYDQLYFASLPGSASTTYQAVYTFRVTAFTFTSTTITPATFIASGAQIKHVDPASFGVAQFEQFVLPHLISGSLGPEPKRGAHAIFNYILRVLYKGCQWKELAIEKDTQGVPEIHYTRIYSAFRRGQASGCFDAVFVQSVFNLHQANLLDISVIHGDGTTTAAKKSGDNIGFSGHKKMKRDKVVAFCDRNCNVIAPFVPTPGNRNESPMMRQALPLIMQIAKAVGFSMKGTIVSLHGA